MLSSVQLARTISVASDGCPGSQDMTARPQRMRRRWVASRFVLLFDISRVTGTFKNLRLVTAPHVWMLQRLWAQAPVQTSCRKDTHASEGPFFVAEIALLVLNILRRAVVPAGRTSCPRQCAPGWRRRKCAHLSPLGTRRRHGPTAPLVPRKRATHIHRHIAKPHMHARARRSC
jgi:hypothetical protein